MSTGYDSNGVDTLICAEPPGGPVESSSTKGRTSAGCGSVLPAQAYFLEEYTPNCFFWGPSRMYSGVNADCSGVTAYSFQPGGTGQTDLCLEFWMRMRLAPTHNWVAGAPGGANNPPIFSVRSTLATGPAVGAGVGVVHYGGQFRARMVENLVAVEQAGTLSGDWQHIAVNCQRGGNLELFIDGVSQGATAGVPNYTFASCNIQTGGQVDWDRGGLTGPVALHARLLTTAEIRNSVLMRHIQVNAQTEYAYNPWDVIPLPTPGVQDALVWRWVDNVNTDVYHLPNYNTYWGSNANINVGREEMDKLYVLWRECTAQLCPLGLIPDLSANGRVNYISPLFLDQIAFSHDPFWV